MSQHGLFKRQPVPGQLAQRLQATNIPAPFRGLVLNENEAFMKPGGALMLDNWAPTMRGLKLRGGCVRWCELPETTPVISGFEYISGNIHKMFAANATKLYDVTTVVPALVKSGQTSGNYAVAQLANASGDYLTAINDAGDPPLRYNGTTWTTLNSGQITGPAGTPVVAGEALVGICKYRNRLFFIERNSMNAWYLGIDSIGGVLNMIPLSGAAKKGGHLLFCASWSIDAGDGIDDKLVFCTTEGELLIFTGSNPADANNWKQEGCYQIPKPMGLNGHILLGGDLLIATVEGIVPVSEALRKDGQQLELAMITAAIKPMWRDMVNTRRTLPWTMFRWEEFGGMFVTWPGGEPGAKMCAVVNTATVAWCRFIGYDATCFLKLHDDMFFGTQDGIIMHADRTGYDDGAPYVATMVGGWELFGSSAYTNVWHQARISFTSAPGEPFVPQISSCVDYVISVPPAPPAGTDPGPLDVWDQGLWDDMLWDQPSAPTGRSIKNTGWVSIGMTGFAHAPVIQVTVAQQVKPRVELVAIAASFERVGVNV